MDEGKRMQVSMGVFPEIKGKAAQKIIEQLDSGKPNPRVIEISKRVKAKIASGEIIVENNKNID